MEDIIKRVNNNTSGFFEREPEFVTTLPSIIVDIINSEKIYISEFVIAKVKGKIKGFSGHQKITDEIFLNIPSNLSNPYEILKDTRRSNRKEYLFINTDPLHQIVVEVERRENGLTEINTIFETAPQELKRLEGKLPILFSSGETPSSRIHASLI